MWILIFSKTFVRNISHYKHNWVIYDKKMYIGRYIKYLWLLTEFNLPWIFTDSFSKNIQILKLMKVVSVEAELYHVDRRTGMTKLIVAFRNFSNEPKNGSDRDQLQFACPLLS
jgi:hypothetical protein